MGNRKFIADNLNKACCAEVPEELFFSYKLKEEIDNIQNYLGFILNNFIIDNELNIYIKNINFSLDRDFNVWLNERIKFYQNEWDKMTKYKRKIIKKYNFMSETFKILDKCSWWVQNSYQSYSGSKDLLKELDCIATRIEKTSQENKNIIIKKANNLCNSKKNWRGKSQKELEKNDRERERNIFSFFAELKAYNELKNEEFLDIIFLKEIKNKKTPDLKAEKENKIFYIEVKRIRSPKEEDEVLRSTEQHSGSVNPQFRKPLKKKIGDFICDAKQKFDQQDVNLSKEQKTLILDFDPGIDARLCVNFNTPKLNKIFGDNYFQELEKTHNITIWVRKYF
jgi:CRISPR/Cas system-associated endoribonuclease Cas2